MSAIDQKLTSGSPSKMSAKCHEPTFARSLMGSVLRRWLYSWTGSPGRKHRANRLCE
jgi:hypothetical protein